MRGLALCKSIEPTYYRGSEGAGAPFADGLGFQVVWVGILMASMALLTEALFHQASGAHWCLRFCVFRS